LERGNFYVYNLPANAPWTLLVPVFTSDTEIEFTVAAGTNEYDMIWRNNVATKTVKNTNVSGIALNMGNITE